LVEHEAQAQEAAADHSAAIPDDHTAPGAEEKKAEAHPDVEQTPEAEEPRKQTIDALDKQAQPELAEAQAELAEPAAHLEVAERLEEPEAAERLVLVYPGRSNLGAGTGGREYLANYRVDRGRRQRRTCGAQIEESGEKTSERR
jgi:hypothetical protein